MQRITKTRFSIKEEIKVKLPRESTILSAKLSSDEKKIELRVIAPEDSPSADTLMFCLNDGAELPETFGGRFFRTVYTKRGKAIHIFFRPIRIDPRNGKAHQVDDGGDDGEA